MPSSEVAGSERSASLLDLELKLKTYKIKRHAIVIHFTNRSGSNYLAEVLAKFSVGKYCGEILNHDHIHKSFVQYLNILYLFLINLYLLISLDNYENAYLDKYMVVLYLLINNNQKLVIDL